MVALLMEGWQVAEIATKVGRSKRTVERNLQAARQELKRLLETTDGNLSVHARKLEEADYIICTKSFEGRMPRTEYRLSTAGRKALERYLEHMEALIRSTRER